MEERLSDFRWRRQVEMVNGEYCGNYEDEIVILEHEIEEKKREIAIEKQIEEHRSKRELS